MDPLAPEALGRQVALALHQQGYLVEDKTYPMEHSVQMQEIRDISAWLQSLLG
jgi:phospholipase/carboxylesterase